MEELLIAFVNTFDLFLKNAQAAVGVSSGFSRLTVHQLRYIDAIDALGAPTLTEIAGRLNITKASVTTGLNKLIQLGYALKTQSRADKRVYHVSLTAAGRQMIRAKHQALKEYGAFIRASLSAVEARQFQKTLTKLVRLFEQAH